MEDDITYMLARAHRQVHGKLNEVLKIRDLPVEQWRILIALSDQEGHVVGTLCDQVLMNFSALSKAIDRMVSRALVHRKQDVEDNRRVLVYISQFGVELYSACKSDMERSESSWCGDLTANETSTLKNLLQRLS